MRPSHSLTYRPDIDGLRALAVAAVVFYHAHVPGFSGGYTGVDVFFVISGYLITGILSRDLLKKQFSLVEFYERRARRILPAMLGVFLAVLVAFVWVCLPWEMGDVARSMKYALLSCSNVLFCRQQDYFARASEATPLLHTWSLGIEEQFYLCTPLLMMLVARGRHARSLLWWLLAFIAAGSLAISVWRLRVDPAGVFFLLPYRAWELALGGLLALWQSPQWKAGVRHVAGAAGLGMIAGATVCYSAHTRFPGLAALLPCVGTVLVIAAGSAGGGGITRLLGTRFLVGIGLISYSVYLWHWPLFSFARMLEIRGHALPAWTFPGLAVLSFGIGWLSWKYIETPFRDRSRWSRRRIFTFSLAGVGVLLAAAMTVQQTNAFLGSYSPEADRVLQYRDSINPVREKALPEWPDVNHPWLYGDSAKRPAMVLWGDSQADALAWPLHKTGEQQGFSFLFYGARATPPVAGAPLAGRGAFKKAHAERYTHAALEAIAGNAEIRTVILAARWGAYTGEFSDLAHVLTTPGNGGARSSEVRQLMASLLAGTVRRLEAAGKTVVLIYPIPEPALPVPEVLAAETLAGRDPQALRVFNESIDPVRTRPFHAIMDEIDTPNIIRVHSETLFVREDGSLRLMKGKDVLYQDGIHLSVEGGALVVEALMESLKAKSASPTG
ncbi:MAG TPA: acyltransferase family protein [Verrucomicrobiales bacterium]|nr:acyltransferase family protein [Verrucomicrobiales bacterium]